MLRFEELDSGIYLLKVPFSGLWTGVILIKDEENSLIDSGARDEDVDRHIVPALAELGMDLNAITWLLNTHSHGDHIGGHARIQKLANLKVAAHASSAPKVADPVPYAIETRTKFPEHSPAPQCYLQGVPVDRVLNDGDVIAGRLQVIHTPGHDDDCVCWYDLQTKTLITGDSIQGNGTPAQGVGFYKNLDQYLASLKKLQAMDIDRILCGPGMHYVLMKQGLMRGLWCLNPNEVLSEGQAEEIDRLWAAYPEVADDEFVKQFMARFAE